MMHHKTWRSTW